MFTSPANNNFNPRQKQCHKPINTEIRDELATDITSGNSANSPRPQTPRAQQENSYEKRQQRPRQP